MRTAELINVAVAKGVPLPGGNEVVGETTADIVKKLKKGQSFLVSPEMRSKVLMAANYLRRRGQIDFKLTSRAVIEGGIEGIRVWRVEE